MKPTPAAGPPPPIRVLIVDDEPSVRDAYRQVLGHAAPSAGQVALQDLRTRLFTGAASAAAPQLAPPPSASFELELCDGAEAAIAAVQSARDAGRSFAVIFLDMRMPPGPDGVWAAERIRHLDGDVEIVISTAFSDVDPTSIAARVPPVDKLFYLQKPFHPHEVRQMALALGQKWAAERRIHRLAYFDGLTGLPNRAFFQHQLEAAIDIARRHDRRLAVLYFDLDNFKRINDTLGHGVGDQLLCVLADRLREVLRRDDLVSRPTLPANTANCMARLGGDEFVLLLHDIASLQEASTVAERVVKDLDRPMQLAMHQVLVTPSVGIAVYPDHGTDVETLFRNADLAMYFAKRQGPGQIALFSETMSAGGLMRLTIENKLHDALRREEFTLHFQPQFDLATGAIVGLEALLRWSNADLGSVPPEDFIPVAESTGLILPIGEWVLRSACQQMQEWRAEGLTNARVSVNVSAKQFAQRGFPAQVAAILAEANLPPECLELEITESLVMQDEDWAQQTVAALKQTGVSIAIDDFGTGYSSLSRLRGFEVNRLKIDRSFVRQSQANLQDRALINGIIKMAQALGLGIVAEGVEEFTQLLHLQDEKCDFAQGFLLSKPLAAPQARDLLRRLAESRETSASARLRKLMES